MFFLLVFGLMKNCKSALLLFEVLAMPVHLGHASHRLRLWQWLSTNRILVCERLLQRHWAGLDQPWCHTPES
jgi:hypothetical protein